MKQLIFFLFFSFSIFNLKAQQTMNSYNSLWQKFEKQQKDNLTKDALATIAELEKKARAEKEYEQLIKTLCLKRLVSHSTDESFEKNNIKTFEKELQSFPEPYRQIVHSLIADLYWKYYEQNRWQMYERTKESTKSEDLDTWTSTDFFDKIKYNYYESLKNKELLQKTPSTSLKLLLLKSETKNPNINFNTETRNTIFDLLTYRAIEFFRDDAIEIKDAAYKFEIDDENAFASTEKFVSQKIITSDTYSEKYYALDLYKELIQFHLKNNNTNDLILADIERLNYVYEKSVVGNRKELYIDALKNIYNKYSENKYSSLAKLLHAETIFNIDDKNEKKDNNILAMQLCNAIITAFPASIYANNAKVLETRIKEKQVEMQSEDTYEPNKPILVKIKNRNTEKLKIAIYKNSFDNEEEQYEQDIKKRIAKLTPIKTQELNTPTNANYAYTETEYALDALSIGKYILTIAPDGEEQQYYTFLNISNIAFLAFDDNENKNYYFSNRHTGEKINNVDAKFYTYNWNNAKNKNERKLAKQLKTNNGLIKLNEHNVSYSTEFINENDKLTTNYYRNNYYEQPQQAEKRVYFFTDRSIYRPGQTVYFKAIVVKKEGENYTILQNENLDVELLNVNYEQVKTQNYTTNNYGSVAGSFVLPTNLLNGSFTLKALDQQHNFNVEEYKRPKFEVVFDTLKTNYKLGDKVVVKGKAMGYNGVPVANAQVVYNVQRTISYPCRWCWYMPNREGGSMQITNGIITTNAEGKFIIEFVAKEDGSSNRKSLPLYNFEVNTDITDINGETRTGNQSFSLANYAYKLNIEGEEKFDIQKQKAIVKIKTTNLQDVFTPTTVNLKIDKLKTPEKYYRNRLWDMPSQQVLSQQEFEKLFPNDAYADLSKVENYTIEKNILNEKYTTDESKEKDIAFYINAIGWYCITATIISNGDTIQDKKYIKTTDSKNPTLFSNEVVELHLDKENYKIGETAKLTILSNVQNVDALLAIVKPSTHYSSKDFEIKNITLGKDKQIIEIPINNNKDLQIKLACYYLNREIEKNITINVVEEKPIMQLKLTTFRDKIEPNSLQKWTYSITDDKNKMLQAELLTAMYDVSLDQFLGHYWDKVSFENYNYYNFEFEKLYSNILQLNYIFYSRKLENIKRSYFQQLFFYGLNKIVNKGDYIYDMTGVSAGGVGMYKNAEIKEALSSMPTQQVRNFVSTNAVAAAANAAVEAAAIAADSTLTYGWSNNNSNKPKQPQLSIRTNLQETAFFFPQLVTNAKGEVEFSFTAPEALTRWRLMAFAHNTNLQQAYAENFITTQKELMVTPNHPRFLRQGDKIEYVTKVSNLSEQTIHANISVEITDAITNENVNKIFGVENNSIAMSLEHSETKNAKWILNVPDNFVNPVVVKIIAQSASLSDGEQTMLNILPRKILVIKTMPIVTTSKGESNFMFDALAQSVNSKTIQHYSYSLEWVTNPAWYAVQALPYLSQYPYDCAEQLFNKLFANTVASAIVHKNPEMANTYKKWLKDSSSLQSNLQKNENLKQVVLQETPWVAEAKTEEENKRNIALLFNRDRITAESASAIAALLQKQNDDGGFSWFKGMQSDFYITQYILTGFGRLRKMDVGLFNSDMESMISKALAFCDREIIKIYNQELKTKTKSLYCGSNQLQYLYMRSFFKQQKMNEKNTTVYNYYLNKAIKTWQKNSVMNQASLATTLLRNNKIIEANKIINALIQNSIFKQNFGRYWKQEGYSYFWYNAPVETQAHIIECLQEANYNAQTIDELKLWLLSNKQTNSWETTKATADACYALLKNGTNLLNNDAQVELSIADKKIDLEKYKSEAGTGYTQIHFGEKSIAPEMANVKVNTLNNATLWGAAYWQYFDDINAITAQNENGDTPLNIEKELYKVVQTDRGEELQKINAENVLQVGDKVKVKIILRVDREMEYIHLKDMRASCFEPTNVLSGYKYQNGLGYYETTKDAATNFFFDHVNKGTYVFEYAMFVANKGSFSNGIANIQCMYAPQYNANSKGLVVNVN